MSNYKNFAFSQVTATGTNQITIISGEGAISFADLPYKATIYPSGQTPRTGNAEVINVTGRTNDTLFFQRAQEGSSQRSIQTGDIISRTITAGIISGIHNKPVTYLSGNYTMTPENSAMIYDIQDNAYKVFLPTGALDGYISYHMAFGAAGPAQLVTSTGVIQAGISSTGISFSESPGDYMNATLIKRGINWYVFCRSTNS